MEDSKDVLIKKIKEWVRLDTEINDFKTEIKERTTHKKMLSDELMKIMKTDNIDCFNINGGSIVYKKNLLKKPISSKDILSALTKYYAEKGDPAIAEEITKHILDSREEQVKETIKRKIYK
jgi:hypothetical protein